jgi:hypothetical protein
VLGKDYSKALVLLKTSLITNQFITKTIYPLIQKKHQSVVKLIVPTTDAWKVYWKVIKVNLTNILYEGLIAQEWAMLKPEKRVKLTRITLKLRFNQDGDSLWFGFHDRA